MAFSKLRHLPRVGAWRGASVSLAAFVGIFLSGCGGMEPREPDAEQPAESSPGAFPFQLTESEWRERLTPEQYRILREKGTERPFGEIYREITQQGAGTYSCAGCSKPLFSSEDKFDSRSGWPSFARPGSADAVAEVKDLSHGMLRTETVCAHCGGHLGHVFVDGPPPTGLRYCINGAVLVFKPAP